MGRVARVAAAGENPSGRRRWHRRCPGLRPQTLEGAGSYLHDGDVSIDNNYVERLMRPWAMGRNAWLFCGNEQAGQRAAMVMSLVQSAKLHGDDPWRYLKDVLEHLELELDRALMPCKHGQQPLMSTFV